MPAGLTVAAGIFGWTTGACAATTPDALPAVDMELLLLAAQWDPARRDVRTTPGAAPGVRRVQQALADLGLLPEAALDGRFGLATVEAYAAWQRSLGLGELAANGLPGLTSLTLLGQDRFAVTRPVTPGPRETAGGWTLNRRTAQMLRAAEARLGECLVLTRGSYSPAADPAGTHAGGGVLDVDAAGTTEVDRASIARALRQVGFATWTRSPEQGERPWHVHAVAVSDSDLSLAAVRQVGVYLEGRDGPGDDPDDGPQVVTTTYEDFLRQG